MTSNRFSKLAATLSLLLFISVATGCIDSNNSTSAESIESGVFGQGTLVLSDAADESRFTRLGFNSLASGSHTLTVSWDTDADVRFNVFDSTGVRLNSEVVRGSNPGVWIGDLIAGNRYSLSVWIPEEGENLTTSFEASIELTTTEPTPTLRYSDTADRLAWVLDGPAPTLDYNVDADTHGWGQSLLRIGDLLLIGGDFQGIRPASDQSDPTWRPWLAALSATTGQPVTSFTAPDQINSVVRSLVLSRDGTRVYAGGDFGLVALNATTGELLFAVPVTDEGNAGRVFEIVATDTHLYIGGDFTQVGDTPRNNLARLSLSGEVDMTWSPSVAGGISRGRSAPVQSLALASSEDTLYVGGTFTSINDTPVSTTWRDTTVSMLAVSTASGAVSAEIFLPELVLGELEDIKDLIVIDIAVYDTYVLIAWGGPNYFTLHQKDGTRLQQYSGPGDIQAIFILEDLVFVGHHGEFLGTLTDPIPPEAVVSIDPLVVEPFKLHSFRMDAQSARLTPEQTWSINGTFGVWAIEASNNALWIAGDLRRVGTDNWDVEGLAKFPAL